jgi:hypothetical protein
MCPDAIESETWWAIWTLHIHFRVLSGLAVIRPESEIPPASVDERIGDLA